MSSRAYVYGGSISFLGGVALFSTISSSLFNLLFITLIVAAFFAYWCISRSNKVLFVTVLLSLFLIGGVRMLYAVETVERARVSLEQGAQRVEGLIVGDIVQKETSQQFTVETDTTRIRVITERFPRYAYGNRVVLEGEIMEPEGFETETGRQFDYISYLAARGVTHQALYPTIEPISEQEGSKLLGILFVMKTRFLEQLGRLIPEPHVALLGGLVVGVQEAIGEELLEAFRVTGLIHIVVLSGYNVTIVAEFLMRVIGFLRKRYQAALGIVGIIAFALLTGASATIVRASIMAILVIIARLTGRTYEILRALIITAVFMVLYNPYLLLFDVSFQLSFMATLGLVVLVPLFERRIRLPEYARGMSAIVLATLATQLFVLPLLLFHVGMVSTVAPIVNILVLPIVPVIMLLGFLAGVFGFVGAFIAQPFAFFAYLLLSYVLTVVRWFSELSFAAVAVPHTPWWLVLLLYVAYGCVAALIYQKTKQPHRT